MLFDDSYLNFVKKEAQKLGYVFVLDSGEGRECKDILDWDVEDLSGWLIPDKIEDKFLNARINNKSLDEFDEYYTFAKWFKDANENLAIRFVKYS